MKRRLFFGSIAGHTLFLSAGSALSKKPDLKKNEKSGLSGKRALHKIGSMSLKEHREFYRSGLLNELIPSWYKKGIDEKYGGFMCDFNADGSLRSTEKHGWYQTRGLWLFSYIYNNYDRDDRHLQIARKTKDFLLTHMRNKNGDFYHRVTREGKQLLPPINIHTDIHAVYGLVEYFRATHDEEVLDIAVKSAYRITERVLSPHFQHLPKLEPGTSFFGIWDHFLSSLTQLCMESDDEGIKSITRMCVRRLVQYHMDYDLEYGFIRLQPNLVPYPEKEFRKANAGHNFEAAWMLMVEALRINDRKLFHKGIDLAKWTFEPCWDVVGGGGIVGFDSPDKVLPLPGEDVIKEAWRQEEALIALMLIIEHTHDPWAIEWFDRVRTWSYKTYPGENNWWHRSAYRNGTPQKKEPRRDNWHHPRYVMFVLQSLERQIARNGKVSDFFEEG